MASRPYATQMALLIEDDPLVLAAAEEMLHELGYHVRVAESVQSATAIIDLAHPRVAILDANLRGVSAYRVAQRLKESGVPFVVATGFDPSRLPNEFGHGVPLKKPYTLAQLEQALHVATGGSYLAAGRRRAIHPH